MKIKTTFKASLALSTMALGLVAASWVTGASAEKPPAPPGQGPCSHGNTGKECKPDPSENGKDCELHGVNGGVNEDHCLAATPIDVVTTSETKTTNETTTTNNTPTSGTSTAAGSSAPTSGVLGTAATVVTAPPKNPSKHGQVDAGVLGANSTVSSGQLAFTP